MFAWLLKVCYEIGNKHATLFRGEGDYQFITPLDLPIKALMEKLGVKLNAKQLNSTLRRKFLPQLTHIRINQ